MNKHLTDIELLHAAFESDKVPSDHRTHLAACENCQKVVNDYQSIESSYKSTASDEVPSSFVLGNIRSRAAAAAREPQNEESSWLIWWKKPAWAAPLLILILAVFLYEKRDSLQQHPAPQPPSAKTAATVPDDFGLRQDEVKTEALEAPLLPAKERSLKPAQPQRIAAPALPPLEADSPKTVDHDEKALSPMATSPSPQPGMSTFHNTGSGGVATQAREETPDVFAKSSEAPLKKGIGAEVDTLKNLQIMEQSGQCRQAIAEIRKLSALSPTDRFEADKIRIRCHIKLGEKQVARRLLDQMHRTSPEEPSLKQLDDLAR
jgi:hypothetical protein